MKITDAKLGMRVRLPAEVIGEDHIPEEVGKIIGIQEKVEVLTVEIDPEDNPDYPDDDGLREVFAEQVEPL
jgi:hypothetical protein